MVLLSVYVSSTTQTSSPSWNGKCSTLSGRVIAEAELVRALCEGRVVADVRAVLGEVVAIAERRSRCRCCVLNPPSAVQPLSPLSTSSENSVVPPRLTRDVVDERAGQVNATVGLVAEPEQDLRPPPGIVYLQRRSTCRWMTPSSGSPIRCPVRAVVGRVLGVQVVESRLDVVPGLRGHRGALDAGEVERCGSASCSGRRRCSVHHAWLPEYGVVYVVVDGLVGHVDR